MDHANPLSRESGKGKGKGKGRGRGGDRGGGGERGGGRSKSASELLVQKLRRQEQDLLDRLLQTRNELNEAMSLRDSRDDAEAERRLRAMDSADDDPPQKGAALSQEPPVDLRQRLDNKRAESQEGRAAGKGGGKGSGKGGGGGGGKGGGSGGGGGGNKSGVVV